MYAPRLGEPYVFTVGWDDALNSYFAQVIDTSIRPAVDCAVISIGHRPPAFSDIEALMRGGQHAHQRHLPAGQAGPGVAPAPGKGREPADRQSHGVEAGRAIAPATGADATPDGRPWWELGTTEGFLDGPDLDEVMEGMVNQYVRLRDLYLERTADGLDENNDTGTAQIFHTLQDMEGVCHALSSMIETPDMLVARTALHAFYAISADADRVLDAESTQPVTASVH